MAYAFVYQNNLYKRIFCLFLCFLIVLSTVFFSYQETYAIVPLVLAPAAVTAIASMLYASGVSFAAYDTIDDVTKWYYSSQTQAMKQELLNAVSGAVDGAMTMTQSVWNSLVNFCSSKFTVGDNTVDVPYQESEISGETFPTGVPLDTSITIAGITYSYVVDQVYTSYDMYSLYRNGVKVEYWGIVQSKTPSFAFRLSQKTQYVDSLYVDYIDYNTSTLTSKWIEDITVTSVTAAQSASVTYDNTVAQPATVTIASDMVDLCTTSTGEVSSGWVSSDWKIPANTIKSKFPFSIPWDLKNAVSSLTATPVAPHWTFDFPSNIFVGGGSLDIDFSQFETWAKIIRWGVLICFNIFLILATRKIIGAGG